MYWTIFLILCVTSSVFGYWMVLLSPALALCGHRFRGKAPISWCCSSPPWVSWTVSSIISLVLLIAAMVLAMEPKRSCRDEVVRLYRSKHGGGEEITIRDSEIGHCVWYLIALGILNVLIIGICVCLRDEDRGDQNEARYSFHRFAAAHKPLSRIRRTTESYRCEHCKDEGFVRGKCCCSKTRSCPICTSWEELDAF